MTKKLCFVGLNEGTLENCMDNITVNVYIQGKSGSIHYRM